MPRMMRPAPNWGIQVSKAPTGAAGGPQTVPRAGQILQNPKNCPGLLGDPSPCFFWGGVDEPPASFGIVFGALVGAAPGSSPGPRAGTGSGAPGVLPGTGIAILGATGSYWCHSTEGLAARCWCRDTEHLLSVTGIVILGDSPLGTGIVTLRGSLLGTAIAIPSTQLLATGIVTLSTHCEPLVSRHRGIHC